MYLTEEIKLLYKIKTERRMHYEYNGVAGCDDCTDYH